MLLLNLVLTLSGESEGALAEVSFLLSPLDEDAEAEETFTGPERKYLLIGSCFFVGFMLTTMPASIFDS